MATIKVELSPTDTILIKRALNQNGKGQQFFTHEVRRMADPYVPFDTGMLKNTAREEVSKITYVQPYSQVQYYTNRGNGIRGSHWIERMMADRGSEIVKSVAKYCGGRAK